MINKDFIHFSNCLTYKNLINKLLAGILSASLALPFGFSALANETVQAPEDEYITVSETEALTDSSTLPENGTLETVMPVPEMLLQNTGEGVVLFEEYFSADSYEGQPIGEYNGWNLVTGNLDVYTLDSEYTVVTDEDDSENMVGSFYRTVSNSNSASAILHNYLDPVIDGGVVGLSLRINKKNGMAKQFLLEYFDGAGNMMEFVIDLQNSRISPNGSSVPKFDLFYFNGITKNTAAPVNQWFDIDIRLDLDNKTFDFYQDGYLIAEGYPLIASGDGKISRISIGTHRNMSNTTPALFYIDDIKLVRYGDKIGDEEGCRLTAEGLAGLFDLPLTEDIALPLKGAAGTAIEWKTDNAGAITSDGRINRMFMQDQTATLTAKLSKGGYTTEQSYTVTIAMITEIAEPAAELVEKARDALIFSQFSENSMYGVLDNLNLITEYNEGPAALFGGIDIEWTSSKPDIISSSGEVLRGGKTQTVTLTAAIKAKNNEAITASKTFDVRVLPYGESYLYETFDTPESEMGQTIDGWNGWTMSVANLEVYKLDSFFTLINDTDTANRVLSLYRTAVSNESAYTTTKKVFAQPLDGGAISVNFRVKPNSKAKRMLLHLVDTGGATQEWTIDFGMSRFFSGGNLFPMTYFDGGTTGKQAPVDIWYEFEIIANYDKSTFDFYLDGKCIAENYPLPPNNGKLASVGFGTVRNSINTADAQFLIDDLFATRCEEKIADLAACENVAEGLSAAGGTVVTEDFELSVKGDYKSTVIWRSSDESVIKVINGRGIVTRPDNADKAVTLTAMVVRNTAYVTQDITVSVPKFEGRTEPTQEAVDKAVEGFTFDEISDEKYMMITKDLNLPSTYNKGIAKSIGGLNVTWTSSRPNVISHDGKITKQKYDTFPVITGEFSAADNPALKATKDFKICVWAESEIILYDGFDEAPFDARYKTINYDGWTLTEGSSAHVVAADTQIVYDPLNPYDSVVHYTRTLKYDPAVLPYPGVVFTYKDLGREIGSGTIIVSSRFYLTNTSSRITIMMMDTKGGFSSTSTNVNTTYGGSTSLPSGIVTLNKWYTATVVVHLSGNQLIPHTYDVFVDGQKLNKNQLNFANGYPIYAISVGSPRGADGPNASWYADDITIRYSKYSESDAVNAARDALVLSGTTNITGDIALPAEGANGTRIVWSSSDKSVITDRGKVYGESTQKTVTLTATIIKGSAKAAKTFTVTVAPQTEKPFTVTGLVTENGMVTGFKIKNNSHTGEAAGILKLYSKGEIADIRVYEISADEGNTETITFDKPISLQDYLRYSINAYVYDTNANQIISNIYK